MLEVTDCTILLSRDTGAPRRPLRILVTVKNQSNQFFTRCRLSVSMRTPRGFPAGKLSLDGGAITPGEQVLSFESVVPNHPIGKIECSLSYMLGRWVTTVRDMVPHQAAPQAPPPAPPPGAPEPAPVDDLPPLDADLLPPVDGAEPFLGPDMNDEDALGPDLGVDTEPTGPDPEDPWSMLDAGDRDAAKALFLEKRLDSAGRDRVRALLGSDLPEEVVLGCEISRWGRWSVPMVLRRLLSDPTPAVRQQAVMALGVSAGPSLQGSIQPLLSDDDALVREAAALAIQQMRGEAPRDHTV